MSKSTSASSGSEKAIRSQYQEHGAREFYEKFGRDYCNPHEPIIRGLIAVTSVEWGLKLPEMKILDLACGSGEVTLALKGYGCTNISGVDPYTSQAYFERTQQQAEDFSFSDIAGGIIQSRGYDLCICSFAMHLAPLSLLPQLCLELSLCCARLLILTPHKRPHIHSHWGWDINGEILRDRVRARLYTSANFNFL